MVSTRTDYDGAGLGEEVLAPTPWAQASHWVDEAVERQEDRGDVPEPLSLSVATVDGQGRPDVRTVLMRFFDPTGPGFVTCLDSAKGVQLRGNPAVAASLTWAGMFRAVRFRGVAHELGRDEATDYFGQRPWGSRISAWGSWESRVIEGRAALEQAFEEYAERWPDHGRPTDVPVPDRWGGYRIRCDEVEFWAGRRNRLHDRLAFERVAEGTLDDAAAWRVLRRQP